MSGFSGRPFGLDVLQPRPVAALTGNARVHATCSRPACSGTALAAVQREFDARYTFAAGRIRVRYTFAAIRSGSQRQPGRDPGPESGRRKRRKYRRRRQLRAPRQLASGSTGTTIADDFRRQRRSRDRIYRDRHRGLHGYGVRDDDNCLLPSWSHRAGP